MIKEDIEREWESLTNAQDGSAPLYSFHTLA